MKTWISFYDDRGGKSFTEYTLNGKWSLEAINKFLAKKPHLKNLKAKIVYL